MNEESNGLLCSIAVHWGEPHIDGKYGVDVCMHVCICQCHMNISYSVYIYTWHVQYTAEYVIHVLKGREREREAMLILGLNKNLLHIDWENCPP